MPIKKFEIKNIEPIKFAKMEEIPPIVIIAGPNGVGKSTLLEALKRRRGLVEFTGKIMYVSSYKVSAPFQLHKTLLTVAPESRYRDTLTQDSFSLQIPSGISGIPYYFNYIRDTPRNKNTPDFAPYVEVKFKLVQFKHEFERTLAEVFRKFNGECSKGHNARRHLQTI